MPQLNHLENDDGPMGDGKPDKDYLDKEIVPRPDEKPPQLAVLVVPPSVRQSQCCLPEEADKQNQEQCKAESPPVNEAAGCGEKTN